MTKYLAIILIAFLMNGDNLDGYFSNKEAAADLNSINLKGSFRELVIVVGYPDRDNSYPVLQNNDKFPLLGAFPDGRLLSDLVTSKGGTLSADEWYKPALNHYFNSLSGGMYTVNFEFLKQKDGKAYTTRNTLDYWIKKNNGADDAIWNYWPEMLNEVSEGIYADNKKAFSGVNAIHIVFTGINKNEFNTQHGGTISWDARLKDSKGNMLYEGPVSIQRDLSSIAHERLHIIGKLQGSPKGFDGFPDRGYDVEAGESHSNISWGYDMMFHNASIPSQHSLYGLQPLISHDLIFLGWIRLEEILTINAKNYKKYGELKLADVNYPLSSTQLKQGFHRIVKIMVRENFYAKRDEYFLVEFHNATEFDKNFSNYDEYPSGGYNKGILIWHVKENTERLNVFSDDLIDLETAVPYNGFYGNPIPDDKYPRDYKRPERWNGINDGEYDYLDDAKQRNMGNNHWVYDFMPDGGRSLWEVSTKGMTWGWYPADPSRFPRLQSMKSDFFTDEKIKGHISDRFTPDTRPSSSAWGGGYGVGKVEKTARTNISVTNIKRQGNYMTLRVSY